MDRETATKVYSTFEEETFGWVGELTNEGYTSPLYAVRLDAKIDDSMEDERSYSLFVRVNPVANDRNTDALHFIVEQAAEHDLELAIENDGVRLT